MSKKPWLIAWASRGKPPSGVFVLMAEREYSTITSTLNDFLEGKTMSKTKKLTSINASPDWLQQMQALADRLGITRQAAITISSSIGAATMHSILDGDAFGVHLLQQILSSLCE